MAPNLVWISEQWVGKFSEELDLGVYTLTHPSMANSTWSRLSGISHTGRSGIIGISLTSN